MTIKTYSIIYCHQCGYISILRQGMLFCVSCIEPKDIEWLDVEGTEEDVEDWSKNRDNYLESKDWDPPQDEIRIIEK